MKSSIIMKMSQEGREKVIELEARLRESEEFRAEIDMMEFMLDKAEKDGDFL